VGAVRLLIVEDDERVMAALQGILTRHGFQVGCARSGEQALRLLAEPPDVVLLDLGLPDRDGLSVCQQIRRTCGVPVIVVTARGDVATRIHGLNLGADDFLVKPYHVGELIARIHAVARRNDSAVPSPMRVDGATAVVADRVLRFGTVHIDPAARTVTVGGVPVYLARKEFDLLLALARRPGVVFTRDHLLSDVWQTTWRGTERTLEVHMASLRRKLNVPGLIETVRGVGYRLSC
jgi:DNA-binding response OmpR family regulator